MVTSVDSPKRSREDMASEKSSLTAPSRIFRMPGTSFSDMMESIGCAGVWFEDESE